MKNVLKRSLSVFLAITIIFSSAYVGLGEVDFSGVSQFLKAIIPVFSVGSQAATIDSLNFKYDWSSDGYIVSSCSEDAKGFLTIPDTYNGKSVVGIGNNAFYGRNLLTSITIPDSVTKIGDDAFRNCTGLRSINITDIAAWFNIEFLNVYSNPLNCVGDLYVNGELITEIVVPETVTQIHAFAFFGYNDLTSITIPVSVTSIGMAAFATTGYYDDKNNWDNGVLYINNHLIDAEASLSGEYIIKDGTKTIADRAFYECYNITSMIIPDSVTNIGDEAFSGCTNLNSVTIPDSVTNIGDYAFKGCTELEKLYWNAKATNDFTGTSNVFFEAGTAGEGIEVVFGNSVEKIPAYLFYTSDSEKTPNVISVVI